MHRIRNGLLAAAVLGGVAAAPAGVHGQGLDGLTVHGYLTQGYGESSDYPIYGLPTSGTSDYRAAALQTRFAFGTGSAMVVQLAHRRLGQSALMELEPDVSFDWGFFQQRFGAFQFRVGKVPIPRGLYNEIRDVGVLLPFYRAPSSFYTEGVETVDGLSASYSQALGSWSVDAAAFGGNVPTVIQLTGSEGLNIVDLDIENTVGYQLFVNTPVTGLRVGSGGFRGKNSQDGEVIANLTGSLDWSHDRFFARAELARSSTVGWLSQTRYAQGGLRIWEGLWANAQYEWNKLEIEVQPGFDLAYDAIKDLALGASYKFSHQLVVKGEWHAFEGYAVDVPVSPVGPPVENNYFLMSVAVAF